MKNWFTQRSGWKLRIKLLILLFGFLVQTGSAQTCNRQQDSLALVDLYHAAGGPNWTVTWDLSKPIETWFGVVLNDGGCVLSVDLNTNNLQGTIPASIGTLSDLEALGLGGNGIGGIIPGQIGDLSKLHTLELSGDQLQGVIPDGLRNLTKLTFLNLGANQLTGNIPDWIGELVSLEFISLGANQLTGEIPSSIGNVSNLKRLLLHENQLTGEIPASLGGLSNLINIQLNNNQLSGCFDESLRPLCSVMYDINNNPKLPWQGDFSRFCAGESQIGATCDDGNANTINDFIQNDCVCQGSRIGLPQVNLNLGCGTVQVAQTICIPVTISAIDSIVASEFTIAYNQQVFEFVSINNPHPNFDQPLVVNPIQSFGRVKVAWTSPAIVNGSSFRDNDVLFEICLRAKVPGSYPIDFIKSGEPLFMAYGQDGSEISPTVQGCSIEVDPTNNLNLYLQACYSLTTMQGTINLTGYGGTAPYSVTWTGPQNGNGTISNSGDTLQVTGLPQGTYTFHIQDAAGADSTKIIDLPNPSLGIDLSLNTVPRNPTCFGDADGRISVNPTGGTSPYFIQWSTGDLNTRVIDNLSPGNYSVTVTDANGCSTSGFDALTANPLGISVIRNTPATCLGVSDGYLQVAGTGGNSTNGFYNFEWVGRLPVSNPRGSVTLSNLEPGVYPLVVSDGICKDTFNLTIDANIDFNVIAVFDTISCYGLSDGSVSLSYQTLKGTPAGSIDYRLIFPNGTTSTNSANFTNLYSGSYVAVAADQAGCRDSLFFEMTEPDPMIFTFSEVDSTSCANTTDGSARVSVTFGVPSYDYLWDNNETKNRALNLSPGWHTVTVVDQNNCMQIDSVHILSPPPILLDFENTIISDVTCNGMANGSASISLQGGKPGYSILWPVSSTIGSSLINVPAGRYKALIRDANDCRDSVFVTIGEPDPLILSFAKVDSSSCGGFNNGAASVLVTNGQPPFEYLWDDGTNSDRAINLASGWHTVTVIDQNNCMQSDSVQILSGGIPVEVKSFNHTYSIQNGERVLIDVFDNQIHLGDIVFSGFGNPDRGSLVLGSIPGQATYIPDYGQIGIITIPFTICYLSCPDVCNQGAITINIERDCFNEENFNLPNILFPDGPAGTNRYFIVETTKLCADLYGESTTALRVFDRWGKIIYRDEDYQNTWSGTDQSGAPLSAGTYYYVLNIRHERGMEQVTGYITLLR